MDASKGHTSRPLLRFTLPNDPAASLSRERLQELVAEYHRQRGW
jgi:hypothetical protein